MTKQEIKQWRHERHAKKMKNTGFIISRALGAVLTVALFLSLGWVGYVLLWAIFE